MNVSSNAGRFLAFFSGFLNQQMSSFEIFRIIDNILNLVFNLVWFLCVLSFLYIFESFLVFSYFSTSSYTKVRSVS